MEIVYKSGAPAVLWKSGVQKVYALHGEEDKLKEEAISALVKHLVSPDFQDFDLEILNAESATSEAMLSAAGQIPFGSERRVVVVKGMEQWRERSKSGEAEKLAAGIAKLSETSCLVLSVGAEEEEGKRKTIISIKLDNALKKAGATVLCSALKAENLTEWVASRTRKEGKKISSDAISALVSAIGGEMRPLELEIVKLASYVGEREMITQDDVSKVVSDNPEDVLFAAIDAISRRQTDQALLLLGELNRHTPKPQEVAAKLLALLGRQYRMIWQAKFLAENRVNPREVRSLPENLASELPGESNIVSMAFKANDLFQISRLYTWPALKRAMERLLLCDLANKGGVTDEMGAFGADPASNLQLLILELTGATGTV